MNENYILQQKPNILLLFQRFICKTHGHSISNMNERNIPLPTPSHSNAIQKVIFHCIVFVNETVLNTASSVTTNLSDLFPLSMTINLYFLLNEKK